MLTRRKIVLQRLDAPTIAQRIKYIENWAGVLAIQVLFPHPVIGCMMHLRASPFEKTGKRNTANRYEIEYFGAVKRRKELNVLHVI